MKSHTSLVAQQTRLSEWADLIRDCQNRPQGMKIDEWCQLHDITKASYYWRLRKVREAYLETAEQTQTFVEVPSPAIHPVNMTSEHKIAAVLRGRNHLWPRTKEEAQEITIDQYQMLMQGLEIVARHPIEEITDPEFSL